VQEVTDDSFTLGIAICVPTSRQQASSSSSEWLTKALGVWPVTYRVLVTSVAVKCCTHERVAFVVYVASRTRMGDSTYMSTKSPLTEGYCDELGLCAVVPCHKTPVSTSYEAGPLWVLGEGTTPTTHAPWSIVALKPFFGASCSLPYSAGAALGTTGAGVTPCVSLWRVSVSRG